MKNIKYFLFVFAAVLLLQGCAKEKTTLSSFNVKFDGLRNEDGSKFLIPNTNFDRFLFSEGDKFYVNGVQFTIGRDGGNWVATSSSPVEADQFYCLYYDPINCSSNGVMSNNKYRVFFRRNIGSANGLSAYETGPAFAGMTTDNSVTMKPAFAIVRFRASNIGSLQGIYLGFDEDKVLSSAQLLGQTGTQKPTTSGGNYFGTIEAGQDPMDPSLTYLNGEVIKASRNYVGGDVQDQYAYYCVVPLAQDGVNTSLYLMCHHNNGNYYYQKFNLTLNRGVVYTIRW